MELGSGWLGLWGLVSEPGVEGVVVRVVLAEGKVFVGVEFD